MKTFFKILAVIFTILFAWSAYLQYNDPDAQLWYAIYGVATLGSLLFAVGRLPFMAATILCSAYLIGAFVQWPETCLLYTSPSPRDGLLSRMPSSA